MFNLFASGWQIKDNPGIYVDNELASQFLVLAIALFVIGLLLVAIFGYYLFKFSKQQVEVKIVNKPLIITSFVLPILATVFGMILLIFWGQPLAIFGADGQESLFAAYISIAILGFLVLIISIVLMWIWLPKYAIGLTQNQIVFVGDSIPFSKITKVIKDEKSGNLYINYKLGARNLKKQKFALTSVSAQFILANMNLLNQEVEQTSQKDYVENFETTETATVNETIVPVETETIVEVEKTTTPKTAASNSAKKTTTTTSKTTKTKTTPVGKPVPKPKPVVLDEELEVEISKHEIPKYKDKK